MKINLNKIIASLTIASVVITGSAILVSCKKPKEDNTGMLALAYLALQPTPAQLAAAKSGTGKAAGAASGAAAAATSAAKTAFRFAGEKNKLMAFSSPDIMSRLKAMHEMRFKKEYQKAKAHAIPTAVTATGGTCNASGCSATLNGTATCSQGGTITLTNLVMAMTFVGQSGYKGTIDGKVTAAKCGSRNVDFLNFPNMVNVIASGDMTIKGTMESFDNTAAVYTYAADGVTLVSAKFDFTFTDKTNMVSDNLVINKDAAAKVNATQNISVKVVETMTNLSFSQTATTFSFKADLSDVITGTVTSTGTHNGVAYSASKTYSGDTVKYRVSCSMDTTTETGDCTVTLL